MEVIIYTSCTGVNNKIDPARIGFNKETGVTDLENSMDVLIDQSGGLAARRGNTNIELGDFHSLFPCDNYSFYAVKNRTSDSAVAKVTPNGNILSFDWIRSGLTKGAKFDWRLVDGKLYYMNGFEYGYIENSKSFNWPISESPRELSGATFIRLTPGKFFDIISGVFVIAYGNEIKYTEYGLYGLIDDNGSRRRFESEVKMIASVDTGVFVSDSKAVYFLKGLDPNKWNLDSVLNYPAIGKYHSLVDPSKFGFNTSIPSVLFATNHGPVIGLPDGTCHNTIINKVTMPLNYDFGSLLVVDDTTIIQSGV